MATIEMNASYDLDVGNDATEPRASVPEVAQNASVSGQNEVDDLLTSLGF